jgi:carbonic anhydrase
MLFKALATLPLLSVIPSILACPEHNYHKKEKRAEGTNITWAYEASYDWGRLSEGKFQSRIFLVSTYD